MVSLQSLWLSKGFAQSRSAKLSRDGGKAGRAHQAPHLQLSPSEGKGICGVGKEERKMEYRWEMEAQLPPPKATYSMSAF